MAQRFLKESRTEPLSRFSPRVPNEVKTRSKRGTKQGQKVALETPAPKSTTNFKGRITQFACGVADLAAAQRRFSSSLAATEQK